MNWFMKLSISKKLASIAALLGVIALFIGNINSTSITVNAKELALSTVKDNDKIAPEALADWLIKNKADYTLVDLRTEKEFNEYTIPNSVNIKMEQLLSSDLRRNEKILLFGSDDITSAQAWFILKSAGYKSAYILKGGMNAWKNETLYPVYTLGSSKEDSLKFETKKQIAFHFGGSPRITSAGGAVTTMTSEIKPPAGTTPKITAPTGGPVKKKKKEGC